VKRSTGFFFADMNPGTQETLLSLPHPK